LYQEDLEWCDEVLKGGDS